MESVVRRGGYGDGVDRHALVVAGQGEGAGITLRLSCRDPAASARLRAVRRRLYSRQQGDADGADDTVADELSAAAEAARAAATDNGIAPHVLAARKYRKAWVVDNGDEIDE